MIVSQNVPRGKKVRRSGPNTPSLRRAAALHALVLAWGQNELQSPWGKVTVGASASRRPRKKP